MYYYLLLTNNKLLLSPAEEFYRAINSGSYKTVFYSISFSQFLLYLYYNNLGLKKFFLNIVKKLIDITSLFVEMIPIRYRTFIFVLYYS